MCIIDRTDVWFEIFANLPQCAWHKTSLVCRNAGNGLQMLMMNRYGKLNTWAADCPSFVHRWKCLRHPHGTMFPVVVQYPNAFSNPTSTLIHTPKISNLTNNYMDDPGLTFEDVALINNLTWGNFEIPSEVPSTAF